MLVEPVDLKWHNVALAHDVNNDSEITPGDGLAVINSIAVVSNGGNPPSGGRLFCPDVNQDGNVSPRDALQVINYLARVGFGQNAQTESIDQPQSAVTQPFTIDSTRKRLPLAGTDDEDWWTEIVMIVSGSVLLLE